MNLRSLAESDLKHILEDNANGFGWAITITDTNGKTEDFTGFTNDIASVIDPNTGIPVSGRQASIALRISTIYSKGFTELPRGIADMSVKPWTVTFSDPSGISYTFKITQSNPDRALGIITCMLETYKS